MNTNNSQPFSTILREATSRHLGWYMLAGIRWFKVELVPAVRWMQTQNNVSIRLKAQVLELLADIYFVSGDLSRALEQYKEAAIATPTVRRLRREVGEVQSLLTGGNFGDVDADLPISNELENKINHLIMNGRTKAALKQLPSLSNWATALLRIRAMWSAGDDAGTLVALLTAIKCEEEITFRLSDWFYIPDCIWECNALWRCLFDRRATIKDVGLCNFRDTEWSSGPPLKTSGSVDKRVNSLVLRLHISRTSGDLRAMEKLNREFSNWLDPDYCVSFYRHHGRFPTKREFLMFGKMNGQKLEEKGTMGT